MQRVTPYQAYDPKVTRLDKLLVEMICKEALPFRLVDTASFTAFVAALDSRYTVPTRQQLSDTLIPQAYIAKKAAIMSELVSAQAVALTTDMWTSSNNDSYMGVTVHFIDAGFALQNWCLAVKHAPGSHTAEFIAKEITSVLTDWGMKDQPVFFVTDSGANVKKAMSLLRNVTWRACFAHTLHLVVNSGIASKQVTDLPKLLAESRKIVGHFKRSTLASNKLLKTQALLSLPTHKLQQDVRTRWNSQVYIETLFVPIGLSLIVLYRPLLIVYLYLLLQVQMLRKRASYNLVVFLADTISCRMKITLIQSVNC